MCFPRLTKLEMEIMQKSANNLCGWRECIDIFYSGNWHAVDHLIRIDCLQWNSGQDFVNLPKLLETNKGRVVRQINEIFK